MSKGPGAIQKAIVDELARTRCKRLPWPELRQRFPRQATQRSLHRALRGLLDRGLVYEQRVGKRRYLALTLAGDTELRALHDAAFRQLFAVASARGEAGRRVLEETLREVGTYEEYPKINE